MELIQTTEYLDDIPIWGQRDYRLYPPQYGDPFYRGRGRRRGRDRGRCKWLQERQMDRPNGGFGRGFSHSNGIEVQQVPAGRSQPDRQEEEWPMPTNRERRENITERHETPQAPPPNTSPPTDNRLFTNWSSVDSHRERTLQCNTSARSMELTRTQTDNQMEQPGTEPARIEVRGNTLNDNVTTVPSAHQQLSQVDTRVIDRETNTSKVESRTQREETRINVLSSDNNRGVPILASRDGVSSYEADIIRGSPMRICTTDIIPQLDGPTSIHMRRGSEQGPI